MESMLKVYHDHVTEQLEEARMEKVIMDMLPKLTLGKTQKAEAMLKVGRKYFKELIPDMSPDDIDKYIVTCALLYRGKV